MLNLMPFLLFDGNCAEAMAFYQSCLGGELTVTRLGDMPTKSQMTAELHAKVVYSHLKSGVIEFSATDWMHATRRPKQGNTVAMYINGAAYTELRAIFDSLAGERTVSCLTICGICRLEAMDILPINTASIGFSRGRNRRRNRANGIVTDSHPFRKNSEQQILRLRSPRRPSLRRMGHGASVFTRRIDQAG
jgi:PhnB protein